MGESMDVLFGLNPNKLDYPTHHVTKKDIIIFHSLRYIKKNINIHDSCTVRIIIYKQKEKS